jgi:hypothetical protein
MHTPPDEKDSIEQNGPRMIERNQDMITRSLNAMNCWTSPADGAAATSIAPLAVPENAV